MKTTKKNNRAVFHLLKRSEGGEGLKAIRERLAAEGVTDVAHDSSHYVGHYAINVPARLERRVSRILFGR